MNKREETELVRLLNKLEPGFLPYDIFIEFARLAVLSVIEFVPLRRNKDGVIEVLLLPRDENDAIWPGQIHTPGTVTRPTDTDERLYELAFERIVSEELKGTKVSEPWFVKNILNKSKRGTENAQIYWVEVQAEPAVGEFYAVDSLPKNLIDSQQDFIRLAAGSFKDVRFLS